MEGRTLRVRAPVNYKAEASGTNTPGWLKSKATTRVFSEDTTTAPAKLDTDKENKTQGHKHAKKHSPESAGGKSGGKQPAKKAEAAAGINKHPQASKQADSNKQTGRKGAAVAKKASANKQQESDKSLAAQVAQSAAKQTRDAPTVIDLLTPVDLIKKSSANRLKQKQADQAQQQSAAGPAMADAVKTEPAGKRVATRGRNANLQVVEVEPKAKRGKRKAASETADELGRDDKASPTPEQLDQDAFLPNRKRSKPSKSAQPTEAAAAAVAADVPAPADTQQPSIAEAVLQEVPGLPGVKHQMPTLPVMVQGTKPTRDEAKAAASGGRSQSDAARSNNSRRQASSGKAARAAEVSKPKGILKQQGSAATEAAGATKVVDKPAERSLDAAMQPTLASAGIPQGMQFQRLQEEFAQLQHKYAELKERKIEDLDTMLQEHTAKLAAHNETAVKLADHWRQEAHRQAAFAQAAGSPAMQAELKQGKEEVQRLKAALLQSEAAVLQKERQFVDLKRQMKEAQRRAEAPLQMDQAVQADPIQHADMEVQVEPSSVLMRSHCDAGQQFPSCGGTHSMGSEATPAAATKQSLHLEEAKEMCPEGHELSESYRPDGLPCTATSTPSHAGTGSVQIDSSAKPLVPYPVGISGQGPARQPSRSRLANTVTAEEGTPSNAGQVQIQSSTKPLVPYPVGISVQPQSHDHRKSRFAEEGDAAVRPAMTPHPISHVQASPQAALQASVTEPTAEKQNGLPKSVSAMMLPRAVALAKATALPLPASPAQDTPGEAPARSSGNAMAVGRLLQFPSDARLATPEGNVGSGVEGPQAMEMDMSLTGSAQIGEAQMLNRNALHALMGLEATPIKAGGFKYIHRDTGMVFEIAPATPDSAGHESDADSGEPELCFNPVSLGKAVEMLPSYLQYEIKFGASQRQTLVGRIMEALGKCKVLHKDLQGEQ